jgi:hypothetical protein
MDHDAATAPASISQVASFKHISETERYHFSPALDRVRADIAAQKQGKRQRDDLERFGRDLHTLEDVGFVDAPGPHMRYDEGRPVTRILGSTIAFVGIVLAEGTFVGGAALLDSNAGKGTKVVLIIVLAAVFGFGVYMIALGIRVQDIGHPSYRTERGENSTSFSHVADQAPQDPKRNTDELLKIYAELKAYARARYGQKKFNNAAASAAIKEDIEADNACLVSNFANERPLDIRGHRAPSYSEILSHRPANAWTPGQMDVTLPAHRGNWRYTGSAGKRAVCPR